MKEKIYISALQLNFVMARSDRVVVGLLALASFAATMAAAVRGGFVYPVELFLVALLGVLLVVFLNRRQDDAASSLLAVVFFTAVLANVAYLYTVAGYLSPARLGVLGLAAAGLVISAALMLMQPVPAVLTSQAKKLIAAEQKLRNAKATLQAVKGRKARRSGRKKK